LTDSNLQKIADGRAVLEGQVPALVAIGEDAISTAAQQLRSMLEGSDLPKHGDQIAELAQRIDGAYRKAFEIRHKRRLEQYTTALGDIKALPEFSQVDEATAESLVLPVRRRVIETFDLPAFAVADRKTGTTVRTLEDDLELLPSLHAGAVGQLRKAAEPPPLPKDGYEVIRLSDFLPKFQPLEEMTEEEIEKALEQLKVKLFSLRELKRKAVWD
jgi:hypothetical protein